MKKEERKKGVNPENREREGIKGSRRKVKERTLSVVSILTALALLSSCGGSQSASQATAAGNGGYGGMSGNSVSGAPGNSIAQETQAAMDAPAGEDGGYYALMPEPEAAPVKNALTDTYEREQKSAENGLAGQYEAVYQGDAGQDGAYQAEEYRYIEENGYKRVADEPLSTFSIDVDTASYGNIRRMIRTGADIPEDAVRIEEMINYFDYDYPEPEGDDPFSVTTEYAPCPWNENSCIMLIGLQAKEIDFSGRPASNLVFLLDVSGSMYSADKLPLVQKAFTMLTENLDERDRVSIVTYAGYESVILDGVSGTEKAKIAAALDDLEAGGSTAGAAGIERAYELAQKNFIPGGNNRVILATDGDLNVGITSEGALTRLIQKKRESGVHLSVLGVGTGNLKDNKMEALADNGDGNYNYLDSIYEAKKVLVDEMGGTLITVAKDVKIQVEFNPEQVAGYRLIGYENRLLNQEDFDNDKVDAGEIGSGHSVTALYEIIPAGGGYAQPQLKYQTAKTTTGSSELLTVKLRYKAPNGNTSKLLEYPVEAASYQEKLSKNLTFACAVAEFGMILRDSENKGSADFDQVMELAESCIGRDTDDYKKEFLQLVSQASDRYSGWR